MIPVSAELSAALDAGTLLQDAHIMTITPVAGSSIYLTDYGTTLTSPAGHVHQPMSATVPGFKLKTRKMAAGTEISTLDFTLLCGTGGLVNGKRVPMAARDGDLRGAWVLLERVKMPSPGDLSLGTMHLFEGVISEAHPSSTSVEVSVVGLMGLLQNLTMPRTVIQPGCVHRLGDAECAVNVASLMMNGYAAAGSTASVVSTSATRATGFFSLGVLTFPAGDGEQALVGVSRQVVSYTLTGGVGAFTLDRPLPVAPAAGQHFTAIPGCDKSWVTCLSRFNNVARFRGFPEVPKAEVAG